MQQLLLLACPESRTSICPVCSLIMMRGVICRVRYHRSASANPFALLFFLAFSSACTHVRGTSTGHIQPTVTSTYIKWLCTGCSDGQTQHTACNNIPCLQIVVLAGGTNDFRSTAPPLEEWTNDIISFIDMVSSECMCCVTYLSATDTTLARTLWDVVLWMCVQDSCMLHDKRHCCVSFAWTYRH